MSSSLTVWTKHDLQTISEFKGNFKKTKIISRKFRHLVSEIRIFTLKRYKLFAWLIFYCHHHQLWWPSLKSRITDQFMYGQKLISFLWSDLPFVWSSLWLDYTCALKKAFLQSSFRSIKRNYRVTEAQKLNLLGSSFLVATLILHWDQSSSAATTLLWLQPDFLTNEPQNLIESSKRNPSRCEKTSCKSVYGSKWTTVWKPGGIKAAWATVFSLKFGLSITSTIFW